MLRTLCDGHGGNGPSDAAMVRPMLPALFEPDKDQIPKIMERIFLQYYKLYNKSNSVNFIPKYDYIPMTKGNGIKEDKTGEN